MEISYWKSRWQKDHTGWHMDTVYPLLPKLWPLLSISPDKHILVPLCGKSLDMIWFANKGFKVTGIEVSEKALLEFMDLYPASFTKDSSHGFTIYRSQQIELWQGDFMQVPTHKLPSPNFIYDKAALVALPPQMRNSYIQKVRTLCGMDTHILLQTFEYDQSEMNGPPFAVDESELQEYFGDHFKFKLLHEQSKFEELKKFQQRGLASPLTEKVYLLEPQD